MNALVRAGVVLGIGMGGFVDGIEFHKILQTHNMLSAKRPPDTLVNVEVNMVWDGLFHALTWGMTAVGIGLLFRAARRADVAWDGRVLFGAMLAGWGAFNFVEGLIDHHLLHLHHVVERLGPSVWDWLFLASGIVLIAIGSVLVRRGAPRAVSARG